MIQACRQFLSDRLAEIKDRDQASPFGPDNIFFGPRPRNFLKTHAFAASCFTLDDKKKFDGSLVVNKRDADCKNYLRIRRVFRRDVLYRVVLYAAEFKDQWGEAEFKGFVDQLELGIAGIRVIPDELNMAVDIDLVDAIRPWDGEEARQRLAKRPHKAIVRVAFSGGVYRQKTVPIIQDVKIKPEFK